MILFKWNEEKNKWLKKYRQVCFGDIMEAIKNEKVLDVIEYPNKIILHCF